MGTWHIIAVVLSSFALMELVAWGTHKYLMHGVLWWMHKDHHRRDHEGILERNDGFFVVFALPSMALFLIGHKLGPTTPWSWIALGILLYGLAYFLVHEVFIHQRIKRLRSTGSPYFKALRRAHKAHHKHLDRTNGECFGMLIVPWKYFREAFKATGSPQRSGPSSHASGE